MQLAGRRRRRRDGCAAGRRRAATQRRAAAARRARAGGGAGAARRGRAARRRAGDVVGVGALVDRPPDDAAAAPTIGSFRTTNRYRMVQSTGPRLPRRAKAPNAPEPAVARDRFDDRRRPLERSTVPNPTGQDTAPSASTCSDRDGAVREAAEAAAATRAWTSCARPASPAARRSAAVPSSAGSSPAWPWPRPRAVRPRASAGDVGILNYALTLEYLEAAFYNEAAASGAITDPLGRRSRRRAGPRERARRGLKAALGSKAVKKPTFDFKGTTDGPGQVPGHGAGARGHGRHGLLRPGPATSSSDAVLVRRAARSRPSRRATPAWIRHINGVGRGARAISTSGETEEASQGRHATGFLGSVVPSPPLRGRRGRVL